MKLKTIYICSNCQNESPKWLGQCPECNQWNSFIEDVINIGKSDEVSQLVEARAHQAIKLDGNTTSKSRLQTEIEEFDNVLGGGMIPGSLVLLGGEPGIGKSTLTLQICAQLSRQGKTILYVSGEESVEQISLRASRLDIRSENLHLLNLSELESIIASAK